MSTNFPDTELLLTYARVKLLFTERCAVHCQALGLGTLQAGIVRRLGDLETASLAELARLMAVDPAAIGRANDTLMKKGWVVRVDDPKDRRRWQVSLSPKGHKLLKSVRGAYTQMAEEFSAGLKPAEKKALHGLLSKIAAGMEPAAQKGKP
jgi:DNA-binding MarR family transcriptional regulator